MELGHFMIGHNLGAFTWVQVRFVTQSKSKTIITRSMLTISLIVFTDKLQGHVLIFSENFTFHFFHFLNKLINFVEGVDSAKINYPIQAG